MNAEFDWKEYEKNIDLKEKNIFESLLRNFKKIYVSRVNIEIFFDIKVPAYGSECKLSELANISLPSARVVNIKPYDPDLTETIEKSIRKYNNEFNPVIIDDYLKISFPSPTEESRKKAIKEAKEYLENAKISARMLRKEIQQNLKNEKLPEDEQKKYQKILDEQIIKKINKNLEEMFNKKEGELMTI